MGTIVNTGGLVLLWVALRGSVDLKGLLGGLAVALLVSALSRTDVLGRPHKATVPGLLGFAVLYVFQLIEANLRIARLVVTPRSRIRAGVARIPTQAREDMELFLLANLNTFTPGSVVLDGVENRIFQVHLAGTGELGPLRDAVLDNERRVIWFIR